LESIVLLVGVKNFLGPTSATGLRPACILIVPKVVYSAFFNKFAAKTHLRALLQYFETIMSDDDEPMHVKKSKIIRYGSLEDSERAKMTSSLSSVMGPDPGIMSSTATEINNVLISNGLVTIEIRHSFLIDLKF
jgi:hypothetical protein